MTSIEIQDIFNPSLFKNKAETLSKQEADRLGIGLKGARGSDNARDAFRHAFTSAIATLKIRQAKQIQHDMNPSDVMFDKSDGKLQGKLLVTGFGMLRELRGGNTPAASRMDVHNNQVGASIGAAIDIHASEQDVADTIKDAMERGELILTPEDERTEDTPVFDMVEGISPADLMRHQLAKRQSPLDIHKTLS